ncbi:MAG: NYN domain-containing protein [Silvanigrellaceae bacterium]|nr:NYN domain-containing protein [Silvanigrellaceae bacterium]
MFQTSTVCSSSTSIWCFTCDGSFKRKTKQCLNCRTKWESHEEKETDVNLALALLDMAYKDEYDHAFLLSRDSDLAPAIHKVKQNFPHKLITIFAPYNYFHSAELIKGADYHKTIKLKHISSSLFPACIYDAGGNLVVERPQEYAPQSI